MKLNELYIKESLNKTIPIDTIREGRFGSIEYIGTHEDKKVTYIFYHTMLEKYGIDLDLPDAVVYEFEYSVEGRGIKGINYEHVDSFTNSMPVFGTANLVLEDFVQRWKPDIVTFHAEDPKLESIYNRIARRGGSISGYELAVVNTPNGNKIFVIYDQELQNQKEGFF